MSIWQQHGFKSKRVIRIYDQKVDAPPAKVFPLICPVLWAKWYDGWDYTMIYSDSGATEEDCVFASTPVGERDALWYVIKFDEKNREIEFLRFTPLCWVARLHVAVAERKGNKSLVHFKYTFTGLDDEGNRFIDSLTEADFTRSMKLWEKSMNHYLETGEKLQPTLY